MALSSAPLSLSLKPDGDQPALVVSGQVDESNVYRLVTVVDYLADERDNCVSINLADVHSIDDAALACLAESAGQLTEKHRRLHVSDASHAVQKSLNRHVLGELVCSEETCAGRCCDIEVQPSQFDLFTLPAELPSCREARNRVRRVAEAAGITGSLLGDVVMAVGEAVANAVQHGCTGADGSSFTVGCIASQSRICISVSDNGPGFQVDDIASAEDSLLSERGRGIHCISSLMDEVSFHFDGGTTIRLVKHAG